MTTGIEEPDLDHDATTPDADPIRLDQFLKFTGLAETGGHAKLLIQNGEVEVNGEVETRRRRKLRAGDVVAVGGNDLSVSEYLDG
jgi:ribosome-associated protein